MIKYIIVPLIVLSGAFSCYAQKKDKQFENVLLKEWEGLYGGVPAFDQVKVEDVKPAMVKGMELSLANIATIAENTEPPTFENTILAIERSGKALDRAFNYYGVLSANMSTPEFRDVEAELAPLFSDYESKIVQNEKLFKRVKTVYEASKTTPLKQDQQRLVELVYNQFTMEGAELDEEKKTSYAKINKELSSLYTKFSNNVLHDEENYVTYLTKEQL